MLFAASAADVVPRSAPRGARILVIGEGLDAAGIDVTFTGAGGARLTGAVITRAATTLEVSVPQNAGSGELRVVSGATTLLSVPFTISSSPALVRSATLAVASNNQDSLKEPYSPFVALPGGITYIADSGQHRITAILPDGSVQFSAGTGKAGYADGPAANAQFKAPQAVVIDRARNILYIADTGNHVIRALTLSGTVSTFAGSGRPEDRDGTGQQAGFKQPAGLAIDGEGNLYVADTGNDKIRKITPGGVVTTLAGAGRTGFADGGAAQALFKKPQGVAVTPHGIVYVADSGNHVIRKIENGVVTTFAGTGHPGSVDGASNNAELKEPAALALDESGDLFVADSGNHQIRRISGGAVSTVAGSGKPGFTDGIDLRNVQYKQPSGIASEGAIFIADTKNDALRVLYRAVGITDVYPRSGDPNGSETVRLFGAGFVPGRTMVTFGSAPAIVTYVSSTELLATTPAGALGSSAITITTPAGSATLREVFQYVPPFIGLAISPSSPSIEKGKTVQLSAAGLAADGTRTDLTSRVTWSSSDIVVAAVSATGLASGVLSGTSSINAQFGPLTSSVILTVRDPEPLPPDPGTVATQIDPHTSTSYLDSTRFLYTGPNPIQQGVTAGAIEERVVAVIRGTVLTKDRLPLSGVKVTVSGHPEYGHTKTRIDGMFDLAANGGNELTVQYEKEGYLSVDRQVSAPWRDFVRAPDAIMLRLDPNVTTIDGGASTMQVARGSVVTDGDGTRRATTLFQPGTTASLVLPDGNTRPLTTLHVRATEYTVGQDGPKAMPAGLPQQSGYTYCVELSADEALDENGATITFSKPVIVYVENFLGFPVGGAVPAGYYDRGKAQWIASRNGKIVRILSVSGGTATLDGNGDGIADDATQLAALGVTTEELQRLAALYAAGQSLWRVPVPHLTPWDYNWPYGPPAGALPPNMTPPHSVAHVEGPACQQGSIIECETLTLGENVPIAGTPYRLSYRSDRVPGNRARRRIAIPLTGASIPSILRRVDVQIDVAGRQFKLERSPAVQQSADFEWDGSDAYGRPVPHQVEATVQVGYVYDLEYQAPAEFQASFAALSGVPMTRSVNRQVTLWQTHKLSLGSEHAVEGGWSFDVHQAFDPEESRMHPGGAASWTAQSITDVVDTVVGTGKAGFKGDGGPATEAEIQYPAGLAIAPNGDLYIGDYYNFRVRRIRASDGVIETVVGNGVAGFSGDGGPATAASINYPASLAFGPDGALYIADYFNCRVRRVRNGIIETVVGSDQGFGDADGQPSLEARLNNIQSIDVGKDGTIYLATGFTVYAAGTNGILRRLTAPGFPYNAFDGDGGPAIKAPVNPANIKLADDGSLYVFSGNTIRRISPDGIINTVAGDGIELGYQGDGGPARFARIWASRGAIGPDGSLYFDGYRFGAIRRIRPDGIIETIAGDGRDNGQSIQFARVEGDGGPALKAGLGIAQDLVVGRDGTVYFTSVTNTPEVHKIRKVRPSAPDTQGGGAIIPSRDGSVVFVFDSRGRHLRTEDTALGTAIYTFDYDANNRLIALSDANGHRTTVERDASGRMSRVVAPTGEETVLEYDGNGWISAMTGPGDQAFHCEYTALGLLTSFRNPRGYASTFTYDAAGLLQVDRDAGAGSKTLSRSGTSQSFQGTVTTALGRTTHYSVQSFTNGSLQRTMTLPGGMFFSSLRRADATTTENLPDGTVINTTENPDPRFGMRSPLIAQTVRTPGGRELSVENTRLLAFSSGVVSGMTDKVTVNGRVFTRVLDRASRTVTETMPSGRQRTVTLDALGRPVRIDVPGLAATQYIYDGKGRLALARFGTRETSFAYDSQDRLAGVTDALSRTTSLAYNVAGRVTRQTLTGGREIAFSHDSNGNLLTLTPPGRPAHEMVYNNIDLVQSYRAPSASALTYDYNADQDLTAVAWPDTAMNLSYDGAGRLSTVVTDAGKYDYSYAGTGALSSITAPGGAGLSFTYDGSLLTGTTWTGTVSGSVSYAYDNNFSVTSETVGGTGGIAYTYDVDGLLTGAGAASLQRDAANGVVRGTMVGSIADVTTTDDAGEVMAYSATRNGSPILSFSYARDAASRLTKIDETIAGITGTTEYEYDSSNRLSRVRRAGAVVAEYDYDANGNRLAHRFLGGSNAAACDDQDRLLSYGDSTFTYTADGALQTKTVGGQTTAFAYDRIGNLRAVNIGGAAIEYVIDGQNRRIGKKINGVLVQGFLYGDQFRPIAELDATGKVVSRFVYADRANVPSYMVRGGLTYRILSDHLGSPRLIVDAASGTVAQQLAYDEFGRLLSDSNPGFQPFGFAGGLHDRDTGLIRFGARDYDPYTGRWTAKDPIGFAGGDTNIYAYVRNDPVNLIDPTGTDWVEDLEPVSNFFAGMGDNLTFGLTSKIRDLTGANAVVDKCSGVYSGGEWAGTAVSVAFGAAHLGRNIVGQGGRSLLRGAGRMAWDNRTWGTVRSVWSKAVGPLASEGQSLHHWLIPQRWKWVPQGLRNAGFNYLPISAGFNSWMNGSTAVRTGVEWGFKGVVAGMYGGFAGGGGGGGDCGCQ